MDTQDNGGCWQRSGNGRTWNGTKQSWQWTWHPVFQRFNTVTYSSSALIDSLKGVHFILKIQLLGETQEEGSRGEVCVWRFWKEWIGGMGLLCMRGLDYGGLWPGCSVEGGAMGGPGGQGSSCGGGEQTACPVSHCDPSNMHLLVTAGMHSSKW